MLDRLATCMHRAGPWYEARWDEIGSQQGWKERKERSWFAVALLLLLTLRVVEQPHVPTKHETSKSDNQSKHPACDSHDVKDLPAGLSSSEPLGL